MKLPPLLLAALVLGATPCLAQDSQTTQPQTTPDTQTDASKTTEAAPEAEAAPSTTYGVETDITSRYDWRGIALSTGAAVQTSLWATHGPYNFYIWNNYMANNGFLAHKFSELDFTLTYTKDFKDFSFQPSANLYTYPYGTYPSSLELGGKFSKAVGKNVTLETSHYVFVKEYNGAYYGDIGVAFTRDLNSKMSQETDLNLGWANSKFNKTQIGPDKAALNVFSAQTSVTINQKGYYLRPHLGFTTLLDSALRDAGLKSDIVYGGVAIGKTF
jgi:hypothetical protein